MQEPGGVELLSKLTDLLREHGEPILHGKTKLSLTASSLQYLNICFESLQSGVDDSGFYLPREYFAAFVPYLFDFFQKTKRLKITQGLSFNYDLINIGCFVSLQYLEIKKVPFGYIQGIQTLRSHLKKLCCSRSVISLDEIFVKCGADRLSTPFTWPCLEELDLSYNGIEQLDDSIKLFPALHTLNLSHNSIVLSADDGNWQFLSEVCYLNLGFNHINQIPRSFLTGIEFKLVVLIIRNNSLENLEGIQCLSNLECLDAASNSITSFLELTPLAHLAKLISLYLEGNPVCFHPDYRVNTVSCMNPMPRKKRIVLDGKDLTTLEELFIGNTVHPVSPLSYIPTTPIGKPKTLSVAKIPGELLDSSMEASSFGSAEKTPRKSKKKRRTRTRQISFSETNGGTSAEERLETPPKVNDSQLEHEEDLEQLKQLRRLGGEDWLPAVNRIMGVENAAGPTIPTPEPENDIKISSSLGELPKKNSVEGDIYSHGFVKQDKNFDQEIGSPLSTSSIVTFSDAENVDSSRPFLVTSTSCYNDHEEKHLFLTVGDEYILEANCLNGKVVGRLETSKLVSVSTDYLEADKTPVVLLQFDYMKKDWQQRRYIIEEDDAQILVDVLKKIAKTNKLNQETVDVKMQCLKCSAEFVKSDLEIVCPDCSSTMIIEMITPSPDEKEAAQEPLESHNSSYVSEPIISTPKNATESEQKTELSSNKSSPTALHEECRVGTKNEIANELQNVYPAFENGVTSGFVIKRDTTEIKTFAASSSQEYTVSANKDRFLVNNLSPRTSALSNSLKLADEMKALSVSKPYEYESRTKQGGNKIRTLEEQSARDNRERFLYKALTNVSPMAYSAPVKPDRFQNLSRSEPINSVLNKSPRTKDSEKKKTAEASDSTNLSQASFGSGIFRNLFTKLSGRLSEPSSEGSFSSSHSSREGFFSRSTTPAIAHPALAFHISEDDFISLDHRLKLFFEVSLFTRGSNESFQCLIKAPVVLYGSNKEMPAVLVVSNMMCYICRLKEVGSGTPAECLSRLATHPLDDLHYIDQGLGSQSFRLEFDDEDGYYVFHVRDKDRCEKFLECFIASVDKRKTKTSNISVFVNTKDPQTRAHIRSQVFGFTREQLLDKGMRLQEQALLFTDPPLIKDRKSLLVRNHPNCFVGKEFVDWLLKWHEVKTRQEAVELGQSLLYAGFIEHASKEQLFDDKEQFYRFTEKLQLNCENGQEKDDLTENEKNLSDFDSTIELFLMASYSADDNRPGEMWNPVTVVVTKTHFALAEQNPQWPLPRRLSPPPSLKEPQFVCIARHKITDITGLDFYEDSPCYVGIGITDEDAPLETAETHWIIRAQTPSSLLSLFKLLKESWENQFNVELPQVLHPMLED